MIVNALARKTVTTDTCSVNVRALSLHHFSRVENFTLLERRLFKQSFNFLKHYPHTAFSDIRTSYLYNKLS